MWIKGKSGQLLINVENLEVVKENEKSYLLVGTISNFDNKGLIIGRFKEEAKANYFLDEYKKVIEEGKNYFDLSKCIREDQKKKSYKSTLQSDLCNLIPNIKTIDISISVLK